jgi:hypothetical protein
VSPLARLARSHPRLAALALGWGIVGVGLGAAELVLRALPPAKTWLVTAHAPGYATSDAWGRHGPSAPGEYPASGSDPQSGETVYRVVYSIDESLRRITPAPGGPRPSFAAFFGGSFAYGEGVGADETTPYHFGRLVLRARPYNYAYHGHGAADLLAKLESGSLRAEIEEPRGVGIYVFNDHHVDRTLGTLRVTGSWGAGKPAYAISDAGRVEWVGTFESAHPLRTRLYRLLLSSEIFNRLGLDWPPVGDAELDLVTRVVSRARELFEEQLPGSTFWVAAYPGATDYGPAVLGRLAAQGIRTLDLSGLFDARRPEYHLPGDPHPSPLAHERFAEALAAGIELPE